MARHKTLRVKHPDSGEVHEVRIPADHDGSRVKVEFPDGETTFTEGWDPAERALEGRGLVVECAECGAPARPVSSSWECAACGTRNSLLVSSENASADERDGA